MTRHNSFYPRSQNWHDAMEQQRQRQVKQACWEDIDDYIPCFHNFEVGDTLVALKDLEFSWGWKVPKGERVTLRDNTSLLQLDFRTVNECFRKVDTGNFRLSCY